MKPIPFKCRLIESAEMSVVFDNKNLLLWDLPVATMRKKRTIFIFTQRRGKRKFFILKWTVNKSIYFSIKNIYLFIEIYVLRLYGKSEGFQRSNPPQTKIFLKSIRSLGKDLPSFNYFFVTNFFEPHILLLCDVKRYFLNSFKQNLSFLATSQTTWTRKNK